MKKLLISLLLVTTFVGALAGNPMRVTSGNGSFLKESASATATFDWSQTQWDYTIPLTEQWGNEYNKLIKLGERAFIEGFNENSKKLKIQDTDGQYRIQVSVTNVDKFYSAVSLSIVPGYKHKVWGKIVVVDVLTNAVICEIAFDELTGGRDFLVDDSFIRCMSDLGKAMAKIKS